MGKKHLYIIDDSRTILKFAEGALIGAYRISLFQSGRDALEQMHNDCPDLVLLDINMPQMDGYTVFRRMKDSTELCKIPVIFLTADTKQESEVMGLEMGAMDYITKPFEPLVMQSRIARILELDDLRKHLEKLVEEKTDEIEKTFIQAITTITYAVDAKDRYTKGHSVRVAQYCLAIAKKLNWSKQDCLNIYYTALLHDIGKIGIPDTILNKPVKLTDEEYSLIRNHTIMGANILRPITMVPGVCDGAQYHHERYDGKGYPYGLAGDDIPYVARIIGIADAYDAITSNRIYEKGRGEEYAVNELKKGRGKQFDPYLTDVMLSIIEEGFLFSDTPQFEFENTASEEEADAFIMEVCKKTEAGAQRADDTDTLTGFPIRKAFEISVNTYLNDPLHGGTMLLMDVDNFLYVNTNYGHIAGDRIIKRLSDVIREHTIPDAYLCRISGDEFAIFYPGDSSEEWMGEMAEGLLKTFKEAVRDIDISHKLSLSIGITYTRNPLERCRDLLQKCDKALYYVKRNGKNSYQILTRDTDEYTESQDKGFQIDIAELKNRLTEEAPPMGAYSVEYGDFEKIYRLVARSISRNKKDAQIILFSLTENIHGTMDISDLNEAMNILENCIIGSLRKGDVTARYSSSQQVVIMIDSNQENGHMIAERIIANYSRMYDNYNMDLVYNIEQVNAKTG
ncbi:MAG: diguanylate cyclase [Lachnospiraceae bacterium]|nr:diguanylate cyclase [Lachnospiraceae bacterium]